MHYHHFSKLRSNGKPLRATCISSKISGWIQKPSAKYLERSRKGRVFFLGGGAVVHHPSKTRTAWIINSKTCKILAFKISFPAKGFDAATHLLKLGVLKGPLKKHQPFFSCLQQDSKTRNFWILRPSRPQRFGLEVCGMRWENDWLPGDSSRDLLIP